jgi:hypothetical protein
MHKDLVAVGHDHDVVAVVIDPICPRVGEEGENIISAADAFHC